MYMYKRDLYGKGVIYYWGLENSSPPASVICIWSFVGFSIMKMALNLIDGLMTGYSHIVLQHIHVELYLFRLRVCNNSHADDLSMYPAITFYRVDEVSK